MEQQLQTQILERLVRIETITSTTLEHAKHTNGRVNEVENKIEAIEKDNLLIHSKLDVNIEARRKLNTIMLRLGVAAVIFLFGVIGSLALLVLERTGVFNPSSKQAAMQ